MQADPGRLRPLLIVLVLLTIAVLLDRYLIAALCPWVSTLGGISLMVVFLDIPVAFPMIDPLPVAVLFSLFYSMLPARQTGEQGGRLSSIWGGVLVLGCWLMAGALIYHFAEGYFPRQVRNGIDSFGIHVDIYTPFTEYSIIPLRGGFILLLCFIIGGRTLIKRINRAAIALPVPTMVLPEKEETAMPVEVPVCKTISVQPPTPVKPKVLVKSVAIVAPRPVVMEKEGAATPLY